MIKLLVVLSALTLIAVVIGFLCISYTARREHKKLQDYQKNIVADLREHERDDTDYMRQLIGAVTRVVKKTDPSEKKK